MWDHQKPSYGEWGSSGVSVCRWWYLWEDTHSMGSPCTASTPQYASAYSSHLGVWKLRWLSCLWKLSVMPRHPARHA